MPHVIVKLWPGKSEQQKIKPTQETVESVTSVLNYGDESVSVAIEEISFRDWKKKVYEPRVLNGSGKLYKESGYTM